MNRPRIIIAGTQSGAGKTSVSLALMASLKNAGHRVQAFKAGPDYIDPGYHAAATGRPSYNLDSWLLSHEKLVQLFLAKSAAADISVIEGVMGLFDGFGGKDEAGSTAHIAKLLKAPVILVLDAGGMSRSAAAMVKGYQSFDPEVRISGVLLNKVGSAGHAELLKESIEHYTGLPVAGALLKDKKIQIPERHLGLTPASENQELKACMDALAAQGGLDLGKILQIAREAPRLSGEADMGLQASPTIRIGLALDRAFSFYYQSNLDLLNDLGADLVPFSPMEDEALPEDLSALYFGGGFPEIYALALEANQPMKEAVRASIARAMPVYAECGGLMYLSEAIETLGGRSFAMLGAVPGKIKMTERLQNFGYKEGWMARDTILGPEKTPVRGHEFHYSQRFLEEAGSREAAYQLEDRKSAKKQSEGYCQGPLLASYLHLNFLSNPNWAESFVRTAVRFQQTAVGSSR